MIHWIKKKLVTVMELRDDKRSIAAGVAIGFFWGFTPLIGLKTLLAFLTAWVLRVNKISAVVAVSLHDVFLPFYFPFLAASYHLGSWLLGHHHPFPFKHVLKMLALPSVETPEDWWDNPSTFFSFVHDLVEGYWLNLYHNAHYVLPVFLGSVVLAIPLCIVTYFVTQILIERSAARALAKREARLHEAALHRQQQHQQQQ